MSDHLKVLSEMLGIPTLALEQMITAQKHEKMLCDAYGLKDLSELNRLTKLDKQSQQAAAIGWLESQTVPKLASRGYSVKATKYSAPAASREELAQEDKLIIYLGNFKKVCSAENFSDFGGFSLKRDGLYVLSKFLDSAESDIEGRIGVGLSDEQIEPLLWHPTGDYNQPALKFPCSLTQLRAFVEDAGLAGCIDEDSVAELLAKLPEVNPSSADLNQDSGAQAGAGERNQAGDKEKQAPPLEHWKLRVQQYAAELWQRILDSGANPTVQNTKDQIAKWCVENNVKTGTNNNGVYPSAEYLRTHVLGKDWTNKPKNPTKKPEQPEQTEQA